MRVVPIASGKGGVGKSLLAANLAVALAQSGRKVVLADLDLGASNLHLIIGQPTAGKGIGRFLSGSGGRFEEAIIPTQYDNLLFIPGDSEIPGMANLRPQQKRSLAKKLLSIEGADYLILDLGAGTGANILDFFLMSGSGIVVTAPTLTATLNAYVFLKNAVFRLMHNAFPAKSPAAALLERMRKDASSLQRAYVPRILEEVREADPENHAEIMAELGRFRPRLVMNMIEDPKDAEKAQRIRRSCSEYLGVDVEHLGIIYRDEMQDIALGSRLPVIVYKPQSMIAQAIGRIADKLVEIPEEEEAPLNPHLLEESYQVAELEAESDYEAKLGYVEELLGGGQVSQADLVELARSQQFEISALRKENNLLKHKLTKAIQEGYNS